MNIGCTNNNILLFINNILQEDKVDFLKSTSSSVEPEKFF